MIRLVLCSNYIDLKINRLDFNPGIILKTLSVQSCVPKKFQYFVVRKYFEYLHKEGLCAYLNIISCGIENMNDMIQATKTRQLIL